MKSVTGKGIFVFILLGVLVFWMSPASAKQITLRFASGFPTMQVITGKIIVPWIEEINKKGQGKVNIKLYPAGALGKAPDSYDLAEKGIADLSYHLADYTPGRFPMTTVFSLPFVIPSGQIASEAMWKTYQKEPKFREEYSKVKVLALFCHSGGHFHTVKKPIYTMSDFNGLKMRTANPSISNALKLWGAIPVSMPVTETYQSLERNVLDGTVMVWEGMGVFKLNEVTKYATIADLYTMPMMIVMNKDSWEKLPADVQALIDSTTGLQMSSASGKAFDNLEVPFRAMSLKKGIKEIIMEPSEMAKMKESVLPLRAEWVKDMEKKGLPGQQVLDTALGFLGVE
ncbi:TRAP transporter substrate-binding protein [Desulfobacula sp.]|uniref:TRAP transporter substrate-binding protein n=1 Tax=Desulfobacula sp. TaxID=2593537 RepID=UPI00261DA1C7|nr:TRAP transporter substrate-binding protein [Desulfobacula sp.]